MAEKTPRRGSGSDSEVPNRARVAISDTEAPKLPFHLEDYVHTKLIFMRLLLQNGRILILMNVKDSFKFGKKSPISERKLTFLKIHLRAKFPSKLQTPKSND
jgi:hypothetical protein